MRRKDFTIGIVLIFVGFVMFVSSISNYLTLVGPLGALARAFDPSLQTQFILAATAVYAGIGLIIAGAIAIAYAAISKPESS